MTVENSRSNVWKSACFLYCFVASVSSQLWTDKGGGGGDADAVTFLTDFGNASAKGRVLWTGRGQSSSGRCRGAVTKLRRDEATVVSSHYGYGQEPYPADYHCRWLFIPDECDLGVECQLGTKRNLRRSRNSFGRYVFVQITMSFSGSRRQFC